jgi:hypothetical protein
VELDPVAHVSRRQFIIRPYAIGLLGLAALWTWQLYATWGTWGNLTIDSGREMYVPAVLAEGRTLYRDVWFPYPPAAPYFNSWLYRLFGTHLNTLYWAGCLSALGSAVFLYLIGVHLSVSRIGWTAGAVLLLEAFSSSLFSFPLPYSFATVYGCLTACAFGWVALKTLESTGWYWMFVAGGLAAIAQLLKPEFGFALYITLGLLVALRGFRSGRMTSVFRDIVAISPGIVLCVLTAGWMISIGGVDFITQENLAGWPTSYFMKTYGRSWLAVTGAALSIGALDQALARGVFPATILLGLSSVFRWTQRNTWSILIRIAVFLGAFAYAALFLKLKPHELVGALSFPKEMAFYVALAAAAGWVRFCVRPGERDVAIPMLLTFACLVASRVFFQMRSDEYAIYYNGPVVLSYLLVVSAVIPKPPRPRYAATLVELVICVMCLGVIAQAHLAWPRKGLVPLSTRRGTMWVYKSLAESHGLAIAFMQAKAAEGEYVLSIPEDTSLYFLSETHCPTRVYQFVPGVVAPGKMTMDTLREIERKHVRYLLWSNRRFDEYGVSVFGRDFDQDLGAYFTSHYRRVGPVAPNHRWRADVWERRPDAPFQDNGN